jgi:pyrroloquinoline-quinone synthase
MYEGKLTRRQFQGWVANRLAYQRVVPRKDAAILSNCPDVEVRRGWIQRIVDHDGTGPGTGGIELWIRLGVALGVPREEMEDERHVLPAVRLICESYLTFCRTKPWVEACASSLTELFAPKIHQERIEAFPRYYPWIPPEALDYFKSRLIQAPRDVLHGLAIVKERCRTVETQRRVFDALVFKLDMLWAMIDTIHNAYREG